MINTTFGNRVAVAVVDEDSDKKDLCYGCICYAPRMLGDHPLCPPCPKHAPWNETNMVWHWAGLSDKTLEHFKNPDV